VTKALQGASYTPSIAADLFADDPATRLAAARDVGRLARRSLLHKLSGWPEFSPGAANAWLLLVTTKPPSWRDPIVIWPDGPPTFGTPHEGFFYPDPLGFWSEVRRWSVELFRAVAPECQLADALSLTALLHVGDTRARVELAVRACRPRVVLYLDEAARVTGGVEPAGEVISIPDPHRPGTVYEGWWRKQDDGHIVGKSPQHPASHLLYKQADMDAFLRAIPGW
jgi:hypothetical protein